MKFKLIPVKEIPARIPHNQWYMKPRAPGPYDFEGEFNVKILKLNYQGIRGVKK